MGRTTAMAIVNWRGDRDAPQHCSDEGGRTDSFRAGCAGLVGPAACIDSRVHSYVHKFWGRSRVGTRARIPNDLNTSVAQGVCENQQQALTMADSARLPAAGAVVLRHEASVTDRHCAIKSAINSAFSDRQ